MTIREQIIATVLASLQSSAALTGIGISREREEAVSRDDCPCIDLQVTDDDPVYLGGDLYDQTLTIEVQIYTRGDPASGLASPYAQAVRGAIAGSSSLTTLTMGVFERASKQEKMEADQTIGILNVTYQFRYLSTRSVL